MKCPTCDRRPSEAEKAVAVLVDRSARGLPDLADVEVTRCPDPIHDLADHCIEVAVILSEISNMNPSPSMDGSATPGFHTILVDGKMQMRRSAEWWDRLAKLKNLAKGGE